MNEGVDARRYLRGRRHGVLSTISTKLEGYPFGSVVPFVLDHEGRPVLLVSRLAEHTRNMNADPRVSLLVHEETNEVQANARLTLVGEACRTEDQRAQRSRYLRYFPGAERLLALGDFAFYAITPRALRFIGGFGDIHWVSKEAYAPPVNALAGAEESVLAHMNQDHAHNLRDYCRHYHGRTPQSVEMIGIDCDGFDARADGEMLRFDFKNPVTSAAGARAALTAMARNARSA